MLLTLQQRSNYLVDLARAARILTLKSAAFSEAVNDQQIFA